MPLASGTRLGGYEVTALIGQGGMGEVYRAKDTKLGRDVALKVLPDRFADDPDADAVQPGTTLGPYERDRQTPPQRVIIRRFPAMSLSPGSRLGPDEITALIGQGGMANEIGGCGP